MAPPPAASYPEQLFALIKERQHFLVTSHARPDGDAIGSALGLMHLLEGMGKQVEVAFADPLPVIYAGLPGAERIRSTLPELPPEAAILLECDRIERSGFAAIPAAFTINIDHHASGRRFADWNWIDPMACAVGAMLGEFAMAVGLTITSEAAICLYTAVLTDTGSFNFASTTAATFALAAYLVDCGASPYEIAQAVYFSNPEGKVRILGHALGHMVVEGAVAWTILTPADMQQAGATPADCEGVVNYLLGIAGVNAAALFRETHAPPEDADAGNTVLRVSLRSKGSVDVARVAESFGGGGHVNASGCTVPGPQQAAVAAVLARLKQVSDPAATEPE